MEVSEGDRRRSLASWRDRVSERNKTGRLAERNVMWLCSVFSKKDFGVTY